jgi:hypothetical protein
LSVSGKLGAPWRWWAGLSKGQQVSFIIGIISAAAVIIAGLLPKLLSSSPADPNPHNKVQSSGISATAGKQYYQIVLPVDNSFSTSQQFSRISIIISFPGPACAEVPPVLLYRVASMLTVDRPNGPAHGSVTQIAGHASGGEVTSSGKLNFGCGGDQLHLTFPAPASILQGLSTTSIVIKVPRRLTVTYEYRPNKARLNERVTLPSIDDAGFMAFRVTAFTTSGAKIDSCYAFGQDLTPAQQGSWNCGSKINKTSPFKPRE